MPDTPPGTAAETAPAQITTTYNGAAPIPTQRAVEPTQAPADGSQGSAQQPPWERNGETFDPERAWRLLQNVQRERDELGVKVREADQAKLSDLEKAQTQAAEALARAERAEREALVRQVALDKGLPKALAGRLQGKTQAELEADADELLRLVPASTGPGVPIPDPTQGTKQTPPVRAADAGLAEARRRFGDRVKN